MGCWRRLTGALAVLAMLGALPEKGTAQDAAASTLLTIDQERLFVESLFGKAVMAREAAEARSLETENARIEADLIAEEQDLTNRRQTLSSEEFSALAAAFDEKVVRIRSEQDAKARELTRTRDSDRQQFSLAAKPVLDDLLVERKALAIINKSAVIRSLPAIDVTEAAIAKVDAALPQLDAKPEPIPEAAPADGPVPAPAPSP